MLEDHLISTAGLAEGFAATFAPGWGNIGRPRGTTPESIAALFNFALGWILRLTSVTAWIIRRSVPS